MKKRTQKELWEIGTKLQFKTKEIELGPLTSYSLLNDPKHMSFVLARYKFCAKIFEDKRRILEIGCGDAFGIPIIAKSSGFVLAIDRDNRLIENNEKRLQKINNITFRTMDICKAIPNMNFDGICSIDVIEHLDSYHEKSFMENSCECLSDDGILIIGTPNITAKRYATKRSSTQHINLKSYKSLKELMKEYFKNVLMFSMNDEIVHTGYGSMAHYLFAVGIGLRIRK